MIKPKGALLMLTAVDGISKATDNMVRELDGGPDDTKDDIDVHVQV
jgi:hypothetical protein